MNDRWLEEERRFTRRLYLRLAAGLMLALGLLFIAWRLTSVANAHENYTGIFNKAGVNCCNGRDCHAAVDEHALIFKKEGGYIIRNSGEFVPETSVGISPNADYHICRYSDAPNKVRCLLVPNGGT